MTFQATQIRLTSTWQHATPADRWQALHTHLSRMAATDSSGWTPRSSVICKWRAVPTAVSTWQPGR